MDTANWTEISGSFIAAGGEQYLTIGNFYPDSLTKIDSLHFSQCPCVGYYIDDISVTKDSTTAINAVKNGNEGVRVYPNPTSGKAEIVVSGQWSAVSEIQVFNVFGQCVCSIHSLSPSVPARAGTNHYSLDLSAQPNGVYFVIVRNADGSKAGEAKVMKAK